MPMEETRETSASQRHVSVLVVDDDPAILEMVRLGLELDGMTVHGAADGAEALDVMRSCDIDVVLLDIMMPRVDGWMTLMEIRSDPLLEDTPVIVLTAKTQDLAKILAFKQGAQQYVTKPFNLVEIAARIRACMRGPASRTALAESAESDFRKIAVRKGGRTILLSMEEIVFVSARNKSTYVHTFENQYLVDLTLAQMEARLAKEPFARVHRSHMVNLNRIKEIVRAEGGYVVVVTDRDETQIPVARRQVRAFREAVGI